ncbi:DUF6234 family protein [Streptomyces sp. M10(2022)]
MLALLVVCGIWLVTGMSLHPARRVSPDPLWGYLVAAGTVGALAVVAAAIASRSRAVVTVWTQCFMAVVVVAGITGGWRSSGPRTGPSTRSRARVHRRGRVPQRRRQPRMRGHRRLNQGRKPADESPGPASCGTRRLVRWVRIRPRGYVARRPHGWRMRRWQNR